MESLFFPFLHVPSCTHVVSLFYNAWHFMSTCCSVAYFTPKALNHIDFFLYLL
ncbi:hypothetical protein M8C21_016286 [Ambrosia artemisiifolia]|uniref:Uncharacterized protein n=1 Tax=Ambrosia artemisiifolia TaxID=4212 RepID=A0AAD5CCF4_AMBAR|nr:hypothetical protein M8C21_016286 [Ambrosia artemisiifolia]